MVVGLMLLGPHGSGKTTTALTLSKEYGLKYVQCDAIELRGVNPLEMNKFYRQLYFSFSALAGLSYFLDTLSKGKNAVLDFSPLLVNVYSKYFLGNEASKLEKIIWECNNAMIQRFREKNEDARLYYVLLVIGDEKTGYKEILRRIRERSRKNVSEESNLKYLKYINEGVRKIGERLEREGEYVIWVPAEIENGERVERIAGRVGLSQVLRSYPRPFYETTLR